MLLTRGPGDGPHPGRGIFHAGEIPTGYASSCPSERVDVFPAVSPGAKLPAADPPIIDPFLIPGAPWNPVCY